MFKNILILNLKKKHQEEVVSRHIATLNIEMEHPLNTHTQLCNTCEPRCYRGVEGGGTKP